MNRPLSLFSLFIIAIYFGNSTCAFGQKINQFDSDNKRTGVWKKYHANKTLRYTGQFDKGEEIGVFKFYDSRPSEHPIIIKTFSSISDSVVVVFYNLNGKMKTSGTFIKRERVGLWKYFYPDGAVLSEEHYEFGYLEGIQSVYYPDGQITATSNYKRGLLEGITSKYGNTGILIEEITYQNNIPNGLAKYFELNGSLKEMGVFKDGERLGNWEYYINGELAKEKSKKKFIKSTY
jgi:antitoxin component YwqK of YwqJK toxin-antitoxin module